MEVQRRDEIAICRNRRHAEQAPRAVRKYPMSDNEFIGGERTVEDAGPYMGHSFPPRQAHI